MAIHSHAGHAHVPARTVLTAVVVTVLAAGVELGGAWIGGSLFLAADAVHLVAHLGIFGVLLIPTTRWHEQGEDVATMAVLTVVAFVAIGITITSIRDLLATPDEPPEPGFMLLALVGLSANMTAAYLFRNPAEKRWSFRAALAHELSDGALTIVGLVGALAIKLFAWHWVDPSLSLVIGLWLGVWAARLLARRIRVGREAWRLEDRHHE
jgi:cobalt-zinc-cadmium efflux system protein